MNDRLKFRVFNLETKVMIDTSDFLSFDYDCDFIRIRDPKLSINEIFNLKYDKIIIDQCTGLKDKNGKLIFENDIVNTGYGFFVIQYCDTCKQYQLFDGECFACLGDFHWYEFIDELATVEVIGNIHQNSELLEKGGK